MIKKIKWGLIGLVVLLVAFTFTPTSMSAKELMKVQSHMTIGEAQQSTQGALVSDMTIVLSSEEANTVQTPKVEGTFPESVGAQASGLWGTTNELYQMMGNYNGKRGLSESQLIDGWKYIGLSPVEHYSYEDNPTGTTDRFQGADGYGFIRYPQSNSSKDEWNKLPSGSRDFAWNACGLINTANALSTLSKRWVHPMELLIVVACLDQFPEHRSSYSFSGAFHHDALADACVWAGFDQTTCSNWGTAFTQENVDACLDEGGIVIAVFKQEPFTSGAHYVCIRQSVPCTQCSGTGNKCYLVSNSVPGREQKYPTDKSKMPVLGHYTWQFLKESLSSSPQAIFIYPHNDKLGGNNP